MNLHEAHLNYTTGIARLMVHHVWHLAHRSEDDRVATDVALDERVGICRLATGSRPFELTDTELWDGLKAQLAEQIDVYADAADSAGLEDACWAILEPFVTPRIGEECERKLEWKKRPFGSWTYALQGRKTVDLHFANASRPRSPFKGKTRARTIADLLALFENARSEHATASRVRCGSWLSCFPPFNALFPEAWGRSYKPVLKAYTSAGWWGQYEDRRGALHVRNAQALRDTGQHPYLHGSAVCTIDSAIDHLKRIAK